MLANIIKLDHPASEWDKSLPIGNGRLGAMVSGQIQQENLLINEETMYYGGPKNRHNPDTAAYAGTIRQMLWDKKPEEAEFLAMSAMVGTPSHLSPFQPAAYLRVIFHKHSGNVSSYLRTLNLDEATANVSYKLDGISFNREYFASLSRNVIAYSFEGDSPVTFMANLNRSPLEEHSGKIDDKTIAIWGQCGPGGVHYFGCAGMVIGSGECSVIGDSFLVKNAARAVIYISFTTDYGGNENFREEALAAVRESEEKGFDALKKEHMQIYKSLYDRVSFSVNDVETPEDCTNVLIDKLRETGAGDYLSVLGFNMGRYLLIASSYNCQLPANLQGIWNGNYMPPWECGYTININLEMNYWLAEVCNLSECHQPLFDLLDKVAERGRGTAQRLFNCRGFLACHNIDMWGDSDPVHLYCPSTFWYMGGAWLSLHLWEHYRFTMDREFLEHRAFPVMEQALLFYKDYLKEGEDGLLHTGPSVSPENTYITEDGQCASLCISPAMDIAIIKELFFAYAGASRILGRGEEFRAEMESVVSRLPEFKLTKDGRLREWLEDYGEKEPGHRHISHLFPLHPGTQITEETPELMRAAEKTLACRIEHGGGHTGWSGAWVANFWARLKKGNLAGRQIMQLLGGKTIENMLSVHPPFQIDGNFGLTAGIAEMLVQSHAAYCELLPAIPDFWKKGSAKGLRLRGGIGLDIDWDEGGLTRASFTAGRDAAIKIKYREKIADVSLKKDIPYLFCAMSE